MEIIDTYTWGLVNLIQLDEDHFALMRDGVELTKGTADFCKGYAVGFDACYSIPTDNLEM